MKIACVFPGQGSQSLGMLNAYATYPEVKQAIQIASEILNEDYVQLINEGPVDTLSQTVHTQPVLLAMGIGVFRAFRNQYPEIQFEALAGHSLGEYSALVAAESIEFEEALKLVRARAEYMQSAVPSGTGAMAAILGLKDEEVDAICAEIARKDHWVQAANYNSPGQIVIAGHIGAVQAAMEALKKAGAKRTVILPVSVPSHSELMREAAQQLKETLKPVKIQSPRVPVWQNATLTYHQDPEAIREALVEQLYAPVRWTMLIQKLAQQEIAQIIECGPGKVLYGLNRRAAEDLKHSSLHDSASIENWNSSSTTNKEPSL